MTPATSVTFFKPEFGDFLYAQIGSPADRMPLTVMSAMARLDIDPWQQAAELAALSRAAANARLLAIFAQLPLDQKPPTISQALVCHLIELLPRNNKMSALSPARGESNTNDFLKTIIFGAMLFSILLLALTSTLDPSRHGGNGNIGAVRSPSR